MINNQAALLHIYQDVKFSGLPNLTSARKQFALISIWNARGVRQTKTRNYQLSRVVLRYLEHNHIPYQTFLAGCENMYFRELTVMVNVENVAHANKLAKFAKQQAYYLVKRQNLYLISTKHNEKPLKLGKISDYRLTANKRFLKFGRNQAIAE